MKRYRFVRLAAVLRKRGRFVLAAAIFGILLAGVARAGDLKIGDAGPSFKDLIGTDDKTYSLADFKDAKLLVMVFTCNSCPVAKAFEDRLIQLQSDYKDKGVQFVAVNVNNTPGDRLEKMKERAKQKGFNYPYLYDETQKIALDYGAKVTPHVFVLNKDRKLAYMGAIDDKQDPDKVTKRPLMAALDDLIAGKTPAEATTQQFGCGIKYEKKTP